VRIVATVLSEASLPSPPPPLPPRMTAFNMGAAVRPNYGNQAMWPYNEWISKSKWWLCFQGLTDSSIHNIHNDADTITAGLANYILLQYF